MEAKFHKKGKKMDTINLLWQLFSETTQAINFRTNLLQRCQRQPRKEWFEAGGWEYSRRLPRHPEPVLPRAQSAHQELAAFLQQFAQNPLVPVVRETFQPPAHPAEASSGNHCQITVELRGMKFNPRALGGIACHQFERHIFRQSALGFSASVTCLVIWRRVLRTPPRRLR